MDKLQWFKFTPTDWVMGKIQRCPEITQARFMRLICLYWNKECVLSYEDAEIEIDKEHLDILVSKKIIKLDEDLLVIDFLNEQLENISETSEKRRKAVLQRWAKVKQKDTSVSKKDTSVLQNDTEKSREEKEKKREEKEKIESEFVLFWDKYNKKQDSKNCKQKFFKLSDNERSKIFEVLDSYILSTPDVKFRKNPLTWLNGGCWNDEIKTTTGTKQVSNPNNERIVKFNTNANFSTRRLPESKFLAEQEAFRGGGYIYKILGYE